MKLLGLMHLLALEWFGRDTLARQPEPSLVMDDPENVEAFDRQGREGGPLVPLYNFSALALSRLLPEGGLLLDLGSGSGRLLGHLALGRPDVEIVGLELSEAMIDTANRGFAQSGLFPRVRLEVGDMTKLDQRQLDHFDVISSNLALEHLPDFAAVEALVVQLKQLVAKFSCGLWVFKHSRPRTLAAANLFPEV